MSFCFRLAREKKKQREGAKGLSRVRQFKKKIKKGKCLHHWEAAIRFVQSARVLFHLVVSILTSTERRETSRETTCMYVRYNAFLCRRRKCRSWFPALCFEAFNRDPRFARLFIFFLLPFCTSFRQTCVSRKGGAPAETVGVK